MLLPRLLFPHLLRFGWLLCLLCGSCAWAGSYTVGSVPNPRVVNGSHVADPDGILGAQSALEINQLLVALEHDTGVQVAVVAVDAIEPVDIFSFAQHLFVTWGIGDKQVDNGLLVLLVKGQRTVRFHTGYGLEGSLPDLLCQRIQSVFMVPEFRQGRYGTGLLAGLGEVRRVLSDPAKQASDLSPTDNQESWLVYQYVIGSIAATAALAVFGLKSLLGYFSAQKAKKTETPLAMRYSRKSWLIGFAGLPALIMVACDLLALRRPVLVCSVALYAYFCLLTVQQVWRLSRHTDTLRQKKKYFAITQLLDQQRWFWIWMAVVFPLPFALYYIYHRSRKTHYRNHPRDCTACKGTMSKLSEQMEDAFLSDAQQVEESLKALDHDIWQCQGCGVIKRLTYPGAETKYEKCPGCKSLTYLLESDTILTAATYDSSGKGERLYACQFCDHRETKKYGIARLVASSGGSSGGGSRSSGGWSGGSSGWGGSSSSW